MVLSQNQKVDPIYLYFGHFVKIVAFSAHHKTLTFSWYFWVKFYFSHLNILHLIISGEKISSLSIFLIFHLIPKLNWIIYFSTFVILIFIQWAHRISVQMTFLLLSLLYIQLYLPACTTMHRITINSFV